MVFLSFEIYSSSLKSFTYMSWPVWIFPSYIVFWIGRNFWAYFGSTSSSFASSSVCCGCFLLPNNYCFFGLFLFFGFSIGLAYPNDSGLSTSLIIAVSILSTLFSSTRLLPNYVFLFVLGFFSFMSFLTMRFDWIWF